MVVASLGGRAVRCGRPREVRAPSGPPAERAGALLLRQRRVPGVGRGLRRALHGDAAHAATGAAHGLLEKVGTIT